MAINLLTYIVCIVCQFYFDLLVAFTLANPGVALNLAKFVNNAQTIAVSLEFTTFG